MTSEPLRLIGAHEIRDLLGVTRQRVYQLTGRSDFPKPIAKLAQGKIWTVEDVEDLRMPAPPAGQAAVELAASLAHLRRVEAQFWERDWRSAHRGSGIYPESHLWDATHGYLDMLDAVESHRSSRS